MKIMKEIILILCYLTTGVICCVSFDSRPLWSLEMPPSASLSRPSRDVSGTDRTKCAADDAPPTNRVDTSKRVEQLLKLMKEYKLDAYIIPSADEHQSEYVSEYDKRREFISGFSGSAGTAVVLRSGQRAVWTDGRYFLQADQELDCKWLLMRERNEGVPTILEWLKDSLPENSVVGVDPRLISADEWNTYENPLKESQIMFEPVRTNLVDKIWPTNQRAPRNDNPIEILELQYAGKRWEEKVSELRLEMRKHDADMMVVTAMDENAWLFNLRGGDVPYVPVFRSYTIIDSERVKLFLDRKIGAELDLYLRVNQCDNECVEIHEYKTILQTLQGLASQSFIKRVLLPAKYSFSGGASYAIVMSVPKNKRLMMVSPALLMKARKNEVEQQGMRNAHIKDSVALIDFLSLLEEEIPAGKYWDELSAVNRVEKFRAEQKDFHSPSFDTISSFGPNSAVMHYSPTNKTNLQITNKSLFLLDSGGQYKDGTTDITRTMHYGIPSERQIEEYTRVLKGAINLVTATFPKGTLDTRLDILARRALYDVGLDYNHGTGHGIGMFLAVHEGPLNIRINSKEEHEIEVGHFVSDEPGYYKPGEYGIRLETTLTVIQRETKYPPAVPMLGFEPIAMVPFERKLIDVSLMTLAECDYLNLYHAAVRQVIGPELVKQRRTRANTYLLKKTEPVDCRMAGSIHTMPNIFNRGTTVQNSMAQIASVASFRSTSDLRLPVVLSGVIHYYCILYR